MGNTHQESFENEKREEDKKLAKTRETMSSFNSAIREMIRLYASTNPPIFASEVSPSSFLENTIIIRDVSDVVESSSHFDLGRPGDVLLGFEVNPTSLIDIIMVIEGGEERFAYKVKVNEQGFGFGFDNHTILPLFALPFAEVKMRVQSTSNDEEEAKLDDSNVVAVKLIYGRLAPSIRDEMIPLTTYKPLFDPINKCSFFGGEIHTGGVAYPEIFLEDFSQSI